MDQTRDIQEWIISVDVLPPAKLFELRRLIQHAWRYNHSYCLITNYDRLHSLDLEMLKRAHLISVSLDEYKVSDQEWPTFMQTLTWSYIEKIPLEVNIALTPHMLHKLQDCTLFDRLLDFSGFINLYLPKDPRYPFLPREKFDEFLDFLVMQMRLNVKYLSKVSVEGCLMPLLNPRNRNSNANCPRLESLSLLPDGSLRVCPFGRTLGTIHNPVEIRAFLEKDLADEDKKEFNHCSWRQTWEAASLG